MDKYHVRRLFDYCCFVGLVMAMVVLYRPN